ncbi:hypothetical protein K435DRAFT_842508 [Dendrothele bispora CBS 962.96]|uniref:G domain-containing protein n=1 Tax=Dendrothele bispora (strain CBS 962.96) TaxID=1314807 RepID=A0A4S8LEU4_DENBC|nr:hypothetical protein K435DRAFT_842508 [Dendrothele bispora CBS 962.96]
MALSSSSLPSQVEETLAACPQFRILLVGNSGVGKSSLVSSIFNISKEQTGVQHGRAGAADINREYTSLSNPRFILHDSQGFEAGSAVNWETVQAFIKAKRKEKELKNRLHAIWLCLETPRTGSRLLETGDQNLLRTAQELQIPVIVVFTKYDFLFNEKYKELQEEDEDKEYEELEPVAETKAAAALKERLREFTDFDFTSVSWAKVSTGKDYKDAKGRLDMLHELTRVTRKCLHNVEADLWPSWAAAQQLSETEKASKLEYWLDLGENTVYEKHRLIECMARIRDDILLVWNFNDPDKLLVSQEFGSKMFEFVKEFLPEPVTTSDFSATSDYVSVAAAIVPVLGQIVAAGSIITSFAKAAYSGYQKGHSTAVCFGVYITDFTLILHHLFLATLVREPPRPLTPELVDETLRLYQNGDASRIHKAVLGAIGRVPSNPERKIAELIKFEITGGREWDEDHL